MDIFNFYLNTKSHTDFALWQIIIPSLVSIIGFIVVVITVKKQIESTQKIQQKGFDNDKSVTLRKLICDLIVEIEKNPLENYSKISDSKPASSEHLSIETHCYLILDSSKPLERQLISKIKEYQTTRNIVISIWLREISECAQRVIETLK